MLHEAAVKSHRILEGQVSNDGLAPVVVLALGVDDLARCLVQRCTLASSPGRNDDRSRRPLMWPAAPAWKLRIHKAMPDVQEGDIADGMKVQETVARLQVSRRQADHPDGMPTSERDWSWSKPVLRRGSVSLDAKPGDGDAGVAVNCPLHPHI